VGKSGFKKKEGELKILPVECGVRKEKGGSYVQGEGLTIFKGEAGIAER